eukprot:m.73840 g.73840  ORF g.73840 m.73840 type:complete len:987 (+) comp24598_c0_seq2:43-3003(+)
MADSPRTERVARRKKLKEVEDGLSTPKSANTSTRIKKIPSTPKTGGTPKMTPSATKIAKRVQPKIPPTASEARNRKDPRGTSQAAILKARNAASTRRDGPVVTRLREEVESTKSELETITASHDELVSTHEALAIEHEATTEALKTTAESLSALQKDHEEKMSEFASSVKEYHEMLDDTRSKLEAAHTDLEVTLQQQLELTQENATHKAEIKALQAQTKILLGAAEDNGSAADQSSESLVAMHDEARAAKEKIADLEHELNETKALFEANAVELEISKAQVEESTTLATKLSASAAGSESAAMVELEHTKAMLNELRKQLDTARVAHGDAETEAANLRIKASETSITIQSLELKVTQAEEERTRLASRMQEDAQNSVFVEEYESAQAKIAQLQEQIDGYRELESEVKGHRAREQLSKTLHNKLQAEVEALQTESDSLRENYVKSTQATKDALKGKLQAIQEKNKLTQELAVVKANEVRRPITVSGDNTAEIVELTSKCEQLEITAGTSAKEIKTLENKIKQLASELDAATELLVSADAAAVVAPPTPAPTPAPAPVKAIEPVVVVDTKSAEELAALKTKFSQLETSHAAAQSSVEDGSKTIAKLEKTIKRLNSELDAATELMVSSGSTPMTVDSSAEVAALTQNNSELEATVSTLKEDSTEKKKQIAKLEQKIKQLQLELDAATDLVVSSGNFADSTPTLTPAPVPTPAVSLTINTTATTTSSDNDEEEKYSGFTSPISKTAPTSFTDVVDDNVNADAEADVNVDAVVDAEVKPTTPPKVSVVLKKVEPPVVQEQTPVTEDPEPAFGAVVLRRSRTVSNPSTSAGGGGGENELGAMFKRRSMKGRPQSMYVKPSAVEAPKEEAATFDDMSLSVRDRSKSMNRGKRSGGSFKAPVTPKCAFCNTNAYAMESLQADGKHYHKTCFKCCNDGKFLSLGNYAAMGGKIYCRPCFMRMFKEKGNYDEGFGTEQHKMKWLKGDSNGPEEADA